MSQEEDDARKEAELLRRDREKAARAAQKEAEHARRDAARAERDREKARRQAEKEAARAQSDRERALREVEREATRAHREAEKAALDAALAQKRAARQVERARREAELAGLTPASSDLPAEAQVDLTGLPEPLAALWRSPETGRRGPRPSLTLSVIAEAAITLADAEGLGAVSMARVAESLGVTTMALYRYVGGKDELLAVMSEVAVGPPPSDVLDGTTEDWRTGLGRWCAAQLTMCRRHPWIGQAMAGVPLLGPNRLAWLETGLAILTDTPLDPPQRTQVIGTLSLHLLSEASVIAAAADAERAARTAGAAPSGGSDASAAGEPVAEHPALIDYSNLLRRLADPDLHPAILEALDAGAFDPADTDDDDPYDAAFGVEVWLDGIAALVERASSAGR